jgi:hypothetical protein
MSMSTFVRAAAFAALSLAVAPGALPATAAPPAKEPGDLWEVTSRMSMEGMPMQMPAQTHKVCSPKTWTEPPGAGADEKCKTLDFKNTATKSTWKMRCPGPPAMTGEGEITRTGPDAYTGTMKFTSDEGVMTMAISGRRVGDCDSAAARRQVAQQQAQMEATQKQAEGTQRDVLLQGCTAAGNSLDLRQVQAHATICDEATMKAAFCKRLESEEGFVSVCREDAQPPTSLEDAAAYCGKVPDSIRKKICDEALKKEDFALLGKCCPAQTQELAQRECAGRKYTEMEGSKYQGFCVTYARDTMADAQKDAKKPKKGFKIPWPH